MEIYQGSEYKDLFAKFSGQNAGILTNQSAFGFQDRYHFEYYLSKFNVKTLFLPEHGLFAELQDQVSGSGLAYNLSGVEIINLYGDDEKSLFPQKQSLQSLNVIIIDIRDTGARYYTFLTTVFYLLKTVAAINLQEKNNINIIMIDSPNPAGRKTEGSPLMEKYESFVGVRGVLHRHGLTPGELVNYYNNEFSLHLKIHTVLPGEFYSERNSYWIPPSPNIPLRETCMVYSGQCLLEGTNLSEGRGTTRPFEIFGSPYLSYADKDILNLDKQNYSYILRPLKFMPTFHKYQNEICNGYQLIVTQPDKFHSLLFTIEVIRRIRENYTNEFGFRDGVYEFRSEQSAIQILAGDDQILDYLDGNISLKTLKEYFNETENLWLNKIKPFLF